MNDKLIELRSHLDALRAEIAEFADADVLDEAAEARFDEAHAKRPTA